MNKLQLIKNFTQEFALAISSIIDIEVTIVDDEFNRCAGTGIYSKQIGNKVPHDSFFRKVVNSGTPGIIQDARVEFACSQCQNKDNCKELASLAYPIFSNKATIGLIAIVAFDRRQKEFLIENRNKLENFLKHMCALLESKIETTEKSITLKMQLDDIIKNNQNNFDMIISNSSKMHKIVEIAKKVAPGKSSVLIRGESGTGKEVLAKAIHSAGDRAKKLLISVNCAAIPEALVESELFGYEEGAFTGASKGGKMGKFELANNSTLFLDEIGDMPLAVQAKLLRVLQEEKIERIGSKQSIPVNIRLICATHKDLESMVSKGLFRHDLYYRINVIPITIPPLRERREDIHMLIQYYIKYYSDILRKQDITINKNAEKMLIAYDWPGNVRELRNIIEYLLNVIEHKQITPDDLPAYFHKEQLHNHIRKEMTMTKMIDEYEKTLYKTYFSGNLSVEDKNQIAQDLGIGIATVYRKLKKYNIE